VEYEDEIRTGRGLMTDLYIHIGMSRTGTTWLQNEVFPKLKNINYIDRNIKPKESRNPFIMDIPDNGKPVLISNEVFCNYNRLHSYHGKYVASPVEIIKRLNKVFPDSKIIFGNRDKESWLFSVYNNLVKSGYPYSFGFFKEDLIDTIDINDLEKLIKELFDEVFVYDFDEFKKDNYKLLVKLCDFLNVDIPDGIEYKTVNQSIKEKHVGKILWLNGFSRTKFNGYKGLLPNKIRKYIVNKLKVMEYKWRKKRKVK
jgi:hypothetical protein